MNLILPIALTAAAAAALINIWLGWRCGQVRLAEKILMGDGGNHRLVCRMRAHANFAEYTPFVLILIALIELAAGTTLWLWAVMVIYMVARIAHAIGMDADYPSKARQFGIMVTMLVLLGLAGYGVWVARTPSGTIMGPVGDVVPAA